MKKIKTLSIKIFILKIFIFIFIFNFIFIFIELPFRGYVTLAQEGIIPPSDPGLAPPRGVYLDPIRSLDPVEQLERAATQQGGDPALTRAAIELIKKRETPQQIPQGDQSDNKCLSWIATPLQCLGDRIQGAFQFVLIDVPTFFIKLILFLVFEILMGLNLSIVAPITDILLSQNPFEPFGGGSGLNPTEQIWFIVKTFAYLVLVFSGLFAGFQWILGEDNNAKSLIFNIIMVALFIDFTYFFVKEAFYIIRAIENGITGEITLVKQNGTMETSPASSKLGSLIVTASWRFNPWEATNEFVKRNSEVLKNIDQEGTTKDVAQGSFIAIMTHIFFVTIAVIIFIVLVVMGVLGLARYLILIFLAAFSSFAVATLAFPRFRPPFDAITSMVNGVFNSWLRHLASWLLVIPIFGIMMILGIVIQSNFVDNVSMKASLAQFIIALLMIIGWFVLALYIAVQMSGKIGDFALDFAIKSLTWLGTMGLAGMGKASGIVGKTVGKIGDVLEQRSGFGWLGSKMHKASKLAKKISEGLTVGKIKEKAEIARDKLRKITSALGRAATEDEKNKAYKDFINLMREIKQMPELIKMMEDEIKDINGYVLRAMSDNQRALQEILLFISRMDTKIQEGIILRLDINSAKKILEYMKDGNFAKTIGGLGPILLDGIAKKILEMDPEDIVKLIGDKNFMQNLSENEGQLGAIINAVNKASKGLYQGLVEKSVEKVREALARLSSQVFQNGGGLFELIQQDDNLRQNFNTILREVMTRNRSEFISGFMRSPSKEREKMVPVLNDFFKDNPEVLQSMISDEDISFIGQLMATPNVDKQMLIQNLNAEQRRRLGVRLPRKSKNGNPAQQQGQ